MQTLVAITAAMLLIGCGGGGGETTSNPILAAREEALERYDGPVVERLIRDYPFLAEELASASRAYDTWTVREMGACHGLATTLWATQMEQAASGPELGRLADDAVEDFIEMAYGLQVGTDFGADAVMVATALKGLRPRLEGLSEEAVESFNTAVELGRAIREGTEMNELAADAFQGFLAHCDNLGVDVGELATRGLG